MLRSTKAGAVLALVGLMTLAGCKTTFEQGEYRESGNYLVLEGIGFRGVAIEIPDGFRVIRDFSVLSTEDWKRDFFEKRAAGMNNSEGLDYFFFDPVAFVDTPRDIAILITPGVLKTLPVTFAAAITEEREYFLRSFAMGARYSLVIEEGWGVTIETNEAKRTFAVISNAGSGETRAYEERIVLGNSNEFFAIMAMGPGDQRERLDETLRGLIESLEFHPNRVAPRTGE